MVASREEEERNFRVVRATINLDLEAPEKGLIRASRGGGGEEHHLNPMMEEQEDLETKVMSLEDGNLEVESQELEMKVL